MPSEDTPKKDEKAKEQGMAREEILPRLKDLIYGLVQLEELAAKLQVSDNYSASGMLKSKLLEHYYAVRNYRKAISAIRMEIRDKRKLKKSDDSVSLRDKDTENDVH